MLDLNRLNKKWVKRVGASVLAACLVGGTVWAGLAQGDVSEVAATSEAEQTIEKEYPELLKSPEAGDTGKAETVYVVLDENGDKKEVACEEWITNGDKSDKLKDVSVLKNIENTAGNEEFTQNGHDLVWDAKGNDIRYKGDYDGELPVDVKVTYFLNGQKISAKEIAGKEGDVEIHFNYSINRREEAKGYTMFHPYVVISAVVLNNEHFADVKTSSGGKVVNDGSNAACVGIAMPMMNENLGISRSDLDIPDEFVVKAYTDKFSIDGTYTIATSGMFADMDAEGIDDAADAISTLQNSLNKLSKASDKLVNGTADLADGADELADGAAEIKTGSKSAVKGADQLTSGLKQLRANSKAINDGTSQIETTIFKTVSDQLSATLGEKIELTPGNYKAVIKDIPAKALIKAENVLRAALADQGIKDAEVQTQILSLAFNELMEDSKTSPSEEDIKAAIGKAGEEAQMAGFVGNATAAYTEAAIKFYTEAGTDADQKAIMATAVAMGLAVQDGKDATAFEGYLESAQTYLVAANKYQLAGKGASDNVKALAALTIGGDTQKQLKAVEEQLDQIEVYVAGVKAYTAGVDAAAAGSAQLSKGLKELNGGLAQLEEGADTLAAGAEELAEGMRAFDKDGIKKLVSKLTDKQITDITDRYNAIVAADKEDVVVGGKPDGMNGASKIIFRTEEVKK